jgi:hypothetical protein
MHPVACRFARIAPRLADDFRSEADLVLVEDPAADDAKVSARLWAMLRAENRASPRAAEVDVETAVAAPVAALQGPRRLASNLTAGQAKRLRRDLVIQIAHDAGISQRVLAGVFDLPRSRIAAICARDLVAAADGRKKP